LLIGPPEAIARATCNVPDPGGDHAGDGACADELVERHVRDGADQGQVSTLLADDLVDGSEGNAGLEGQAECDRIPVVDVFGDRIMER
jgi:hypothetical protein